MFATFIISRVWVFSFNVLQESHLQWWENRVFVALLTIYISDINVEYLGERFPVVFFFCMYDFQTKGTLSCCSYELDVAVMSRMVRCTCTKDLVRFLSYLTLTLYLGPWESLFLMQQISNTWFNTDVINESWCGNTHWASPAMTSLVSLNCRELKQDKETETLFHCVY